MQSSMVVLPADDSESTNVDLFFNKFTLN